MPDRQRTHAGLIALAPSDGAFTVDGGTGQMPAGLLKLAKADVKLSHRVTKIQRSGSSWKVIVDDSAAAKKARANGSGGDDPMRADGDAVEGWWGKDPYDAVIVAAPFSQSGIAVEGLDHGHRSSSAMFESAPGGTVSYQTVYTTYVKAKLRRDYFGYATNGKGGSGVVEDGELPGFIGTSEGSGAGFSCIGTLNSSVDGNGTRLMKLFSTEKLERGLLERVFEEPEVPAEERWKAYPVFRVPELEEGRMRLAPGLYYVNALEAGASCVEIAAVAARNVAALLLQDLQSGDVADVARAAASTLKVEQEL